MAFKGRCFDHRVKIFCSNASHITHGFGVVADEIADADHVSRRVVFRQRMRLVDEDEPVIRNVLYRCSRRSFVRPIPLRALDGGFADA